MGMNFKIITDHNVLKALKNKNELEGRLLRWSKYLIGFDFEIIYCPGNMNVVADILSRSRYTITQAEMEDRN